MKKENRLSKLDKIAEFYIINLGFNGDKLRNALLKDKEYQMILKRKKQKLTNKTKISPSEKKKYVLSSDSDFEILEKCKQLEKLRLNKSDKSLIKLIKTQLEENWRTPLINYLDKLLIKYKK